jgi:hypothetical protein
MLLLRLVLRQDRALCGLAPEMALDLAIKLLIQVRFMFILSFWFASLF